jgi:biotin carboxylase
MNRANARTPAILCIASFFKGNDSIRECRRAGVRVVLLTREKLRSADWARASLADLITVPDAGDADSYLRAATEVARHRRVARVVALEEYDVISAARIREQLCLPGMGSTGARCFQDKLAMRARARATGITQPEFVHALNAEEVAAFLARVAPPWLLKPRIGASSMGMQKLADAGQVWQALAQLDTREAWHERAPAHLIEHFEPGDIFHVDSLVADGRILFTNVEQYGTPPFEVAHMGGVATSHTVRRGSPDERKLLACNRRLLAAFGFACGTTHAEFIRTAAGAYYFLEVAARVGGAYTAETIEAATGINLWREWARLELATPEQSYALPPTRADYAGIAISLARQEAPDTSAYDEPEISLRVHKPWHVGLVVRSHAHARVVALLKAYARRFAADFTAVVPAEERAAQHL